MTHDSRIPWDLAPQEYTPLTFEDQEAIGLLLDTEYAQRLNTRETDFLIDIRQKETLSPRQRAWFEAICQRVLV